MLHKLSSALAAGFLGGIGNVVYLAIAAAIGLPALFGLGLPSFANAPFLYKQAFWGGLWALVFVLPFMPKQWIVRAILVAAITASATFFVFFPMATVDGNGPGLAGLNIGPLMPVYVFLADVAYGLVASKVYQTLVERNDMASSAMLS